MPVSVPPPLSLGGGGDATGGYRPFHSGLHIREMEVVVVVVVVVVVKAGMCSYAVVMDAVRRDPASTSIMWSLWQ